MEDTPSGTRGSRAPESEWPNAEYAVTELPAPVAAPFDAARASDHEFVQLVVGRDQQAFAAIYRLHGDACFGLARKVLHERALAEEVVQEVFVRLWNAPERYDATRGSLRSFLLAQIHGRSVDVLRSERSRRLREEKESWRKAVHTQGDDIEREVIDLAQAEAVRTALTQLSDGERQAIELAYFGGHSYRDVAVLLEQAEGTVKSRIRTGLLRLRATLIDAGYPSS